MSYSDDTLLHMFMMQIQLDQNRARLYVGHNCVFQKGFFYKSLGTLFSPPLLLPRSSARCKPTIANKLAKLS